jgi:hypothetical protein
MKVSFALGSSRAEAEVVEWTEHNVKVRVGAGKKLIKRHWDKHDVQIVTMSQEEAEEVVKIAQKRNPGMELAMPVEEAAKEVLKDLEERKGKPDGVLEST